MSTSNEYYLEKLNKEIELINNSFSELLQENKPQELYEPCSYILKSGGKRLRPYLVLQSAFAIKGNEKKFLNAALAVEVLHNFTLVHDDIMDNADMRRGKKTLHIRNDLSTAILAGDTLFAIAYRLLLKDCQKNTNEVISKFTETIIEICEGQSYDTAFETMKNVSIAEYENMIYKKTGALIEACCFIGAQLADGSQKEINALTEFGKNLGLAFQIQDDYLDIMGNEEEFGKSVGIDLVEGKKTFIFLKALELAEGNDKKLLQKMVDNNGIEKSEVKTYKDLYIKLGVLEFAEKEIKKYTENALKFLQDLEDSDAKKTLIWLANYLIKRTK